jgi:hypothetical protein
MSAIFPREIIDQFLTDRGVIMAFRCTCNEYAGVVGRGHDVYAIITPGYTTITSTYGILIHCVGVHQKSMHHYVLWLTAREILLWKEPRHHSPIVPISVIIYHGELTSPPTTKRLKIVRSAEYVVNIVYLLDDPAERYSKKIDAIMGKHLRRNPEKCVIIGVHCSAVKVKAYFAQLLWGGGGCVVGGGA